MTGHGMDRACKAEQTQLEEQRDAGRAIFQKEREGLQSMLRVLPSLSHLPSLVEASNEAQDWAKQQLPCCKQQAGPTASSQQLIPACCVIRAPL